MLRDIVGLAVAVFDVLTEPVVVFEELYVRVELLLPVCVCVGALVPVVAGLELDVLEGAMLRVACSV
jgi:hypothetical protein